MRRLAALLAASGPSLALAASTPLDFTFSTAERWRVANAAEIMYGWVVAELQLFADAACSDALTASTLRASGSTPALPPSRAVDSLTFTEWRAPCHVCGVGEAWLEMEFTAAVEVMCFRIFQWGERDYAAQSLWLQRFDANAAAGGSWVDVLRGDSLQGGRWEEVHFTRCAALAPPNFGVVRVSNQGIYPSEATFTCKGIRPMTGSDRSVCSPDGTWSSEPPVCWEAIHFVGAAAFVIAMDVFVFFLYYRCVMLRKPTPLRADSLIPQDYLGQWNSDLVGGCSSDISYGVTTLFCPCRVAATWQQAGMIPFQYGVLLPHFCCCCMPCIGTYFRRLLRQRFSIRRSSTTLDCFAWTTLSCCAMVQEAKMVDAMCVVAHEEARAKEAADQRKASAEEQRRGKVGPVQSTMSMSLGPSPKSVGASGFRFGLSTTHGALRTPRAALETMSTAV